MTGVGFVADAGIQAEMGFEAHPFFIQWALWAYFLCVRSSHSK
jgi:hypothetical protein